MAREINKALGKFSEAMVYMDWVYKKISTIFFSGTSDKIFNGMVSDIFNAINGPIKK